MRMHHTPHRPASATTPRPAWRSVAPSGALLVLGLLIVACGSQFMPDRLEVAARPVGTVHSAGVATATPVPPTTAPVPEATVRAAEATRLAAGTPTPRPTVIVEAVAGDPAIARLIADLGEQGIPIEPRNRSQVGWLDGAPGQTYAAGDDWLFVHRYPTVAAARTAAARIPPTGDNGLIDWIGPPHFFRCDNRIVLYLGQAAATLDALTEACGPQFAGT
jgi:hypothetical protein